MAAAFAPAPVAPAHPSSLAEEPPELPPGLSTAAPSAIDGCASEDPAAYNSSPANGAHSEQFVADAKQFFDELFEHDQEPPTTDMDGVRGPAPA